MAAEPRSLTGKVIAITGGRAGSARPPRRRWSAGRQGRDRRPRPRARRADRGGARRRHACARARRHPPRLVRGLPRSGRGAARLARRADQQRGDHAARPLLGGGRPDRPADGGHQRPRGAVRDEAGHPPHAAAGQRSHRQHRVGRGEGGFPGGATYCGTKHFVVGVSEAVRAELRDTEIDLSVVMPVVVNTELGSGLVETRGIKKIEPEDVAEAIVGALERPRFDVWVPRESGAINKVMQLLPRAGREGVARLLKADRVLAGADPAARASYEERAGARRAPARRRASSAPRYGPRRRASDATAPIGRRSSRREDRPIPRSVGSPAPACEGHSCRCCPPIASARRPGRGAAADRGQAGRERERGR